ncbi:DUF1826 domain-containing protein [uncultured Sphingomonas sp.]|uniref:DUF1826 domain-containing protein n=1 Tax=uncultured Sphingomonas sp. TaxID=158754 RepID=UPI0025E8A288|nr:DUF1826 domain-containing protein [uncultured Sphingomonas sp.]
MLSYNTSQPSKVTPIARSNGGWGSNPPAIADPTTNLAVCRRPSATTAFNPRNLSRVDDLSSDFAVATLASDLPGRMSDAGYETPGMDALASDIACRATRFAQGTDTDRVAIRLEIVETDACRRFHADYVTARLICTDVGPVTQCAVALAAGAAPETLTIRDLRSGDVAIFEGRLWAPDAPAIHRSPPIAVSGLQ